MNARQLLNQWNLRPDKQLGQNFLIDRAILAKIVAAAELTPDDLVLEIGAGTGTLTGWLARQAGRVIAVEMDPRLMSVLQSVLADFDNVTLIQGDILTLDLADLLGKASHPYKVVANLPYYITSAVLRHLLEATLKPQRMIITVQREVAERIVAKPGQMSLLAVSVQFYVHPELLFCIPPDSFHPAPKVESAVVRLEPRAAPLASEDETAAFFRIVRAGFAQRRKQLHNALSAGLGRLPRHEMAARLRKAGIDPQRRAQTLALEEWVQITRVLGDLDAE
jgi:16S rRNA (adenine1518-N6/adenine1519-N6)-dimethyltransferase